MVKAQSAIENTLSKGMSFMDLKDIIVAIINDPDIDLGYEYAPQEDDSVFRITEDDDLLKDLFYTIREESEEEYKSLPTSDEPGAEAEKVPLSLNQNSFIHSDYFLICLACILHTWLFARTYLQPNYGNGFFGNVYLLGEQHYEINIAGTPLP